MEIDKDFGGVYLVVDPSVEQVLLLDKAKQALDAGVRIVQIWNNWPENLNCEGKEQLIMDIRNLTARYHVPVLVTEEWELLKTTRLDGVHFDEIPGDLERIRSEVGREFITGLTCENDLERVKWADQNDVDYISFCAMFPSPSVSSCEIVRPETVRKAREITGLPLFLSGGITPDRIAELADLDFDGVAVISGIMNSDKPGQSARAYQEALEGE